MADVLTPDICIIGAGAGGLALAAGARAAGASVVLIERGRMGGEALHTGSIASKALVGAAAHARAMSGAAPFGIANDEPKINFRRVHDHIHEVIDAIAPQSAITRYEALGVTVIGAEAKFIDKRTLSAGEAVIRARRFVIATGSSPMVPAIEGLSRVPYFTTDTLFDNTRKLTHLVIIGGGPAGVELAQAYRRLGAEVTIVEAATALSGSDAELVAVALRRMREEGVAILEHASVTAIQPRALGIGVVIRHNDAERTLDASHILVSVGRRPNLDDLDLDKAGIRTEKLQPHLLTLDASLRTSNRQVYAIGDAAGGDQHSHLAEHQAAIVLDNALYGKRRRFDAAIVPYATYTDPEIAEVGLTEAAARLRLKSGFEVTRITFAENDRARTSRQTEGLVKLITDRSGRILGAGVVGAGAGEMIALYAFALANGLSVQNLANFVAPHPTLSEAAQRLGELYLREHDKPDWKQRLLKLNRLLP